MQRIISFLLLIVFLCASSCKPDVDSQSDKSTLPDSEEKQGANSLTEMAHKGNAEAQSLLGLMYGKGIGATQDYKKAFEWFKKAAQQSYAEAQYNLGVMYYKGKGVPQDYKKAAEWFTKAAQQGFASAQYDLGKMYHKGIGVPQDYNKAIEWYSKAAQQSYVKAQRILGLMYGAGAGVAQDYKKAVEWYTKAAQQDDADAQYQLGLMYDFGYGVTQDYKKAVGWYKKAAQQGVVEAQAKLGAMYQLGQGVPQDYTKAAKWVKKAAQQGFASAQFALGMSLSLGQGVKEDYVEAYKWVLLAGKNGYDYSEVSKVKDALKRLMTPAQIAQAKDLARNFAAKKEETSVEFPEYFSEKHNFKVRFPGKVKVTEYGLVTHYTVEIEGEGAYNIIVNPFQKPVLGNEAIQAVLDGYLRGRLIFFGDKATVLESRHIVFGGRKALQYEYTVESQGTLAYSKGLHFIVGKFGYGINCVCTEETKPLVYSKYKDFVESFRIIESH